MSGSQETATRPTKIDIPESLSAQLHREAGAEKFGLKQQAFADVLQEVASKYLPATSSPKEVLDFLTHLRVEELALARGCALGNESAWEIFLTRYREKLFNAAYSIVQGDANARELADSLYADLYGTRTSDGGSKKFPMRTRPDAQSASRCQLLDAKVGEEIQNFLGAGGGGDAWRRPSCKTSAKACCFKPNFSAPASR